MKLNWKRMKVYKKEEEKALNKCMCACVCELYQFSALLWCLLYFIASNGTLSRTYCLLLIYMKSLQRHQQWHEWVRIQQQQKLLFYIFIFIFYVWRDYNVVQFGNKYKKDDKNACVCMWGESWSVFWDEYQKI